MFYRFSVSALIGAAVAGSVVYFTNDRVVKGYRADVAELAAQQKAAADSFAVLLADISDRIAALDTARQSDVTASGEALAALQSQLDEAVRTLGVVEYTVSALPDAETAAAQNTALLDALKNMQTQLDAPGATGTSPSQPMEGQ